MTTVTNQKAAYRMLGRREEWRSPLSPPAVRALDGGW
jgi:hypothetical protein